MLSRRFCRFCWIQFKEREFYIQCFGPCNGLFHVKCAKIKESVANNMKLLERLIWYCEICRRLKKLQVFFKISVCDDYSLPIDFVKKRPSSFDPCLAETLPDNWAVIAPSPLSEHVSFLDPPVPAFKHPPITLIQHQQYHPQQHIQQQQQQQQQHHHQQQYIQQQQHQQKSHLVPQPQYTNVKLIEGYSDPKDSRTQPRTNRRSRKDTTTINRNNYNSDSSAPKSSADDDDNKTNDNQLGSRKVPELNSPDSISEDLVHPLQPYKSPKRLTGIPEVHKRNPSPYYYSDLLKSKEKEEVKEEKTKCRQSTASEPPQTAQTETQTPYRKSTSLDVPETNESANPNECVIPSEINKQDQQRQHCQEQQKQQNQQQKTSTTTKQKRLHKTLPTPENHSRRYSITEDGVRIIRCTSPSTTTSDDSDCSECQQRREWHAKALALVRKTCNVHANQPLQVGGFIASSGNGVDLQSVNILGNCGASGDPCDPSMPPHRILGPTVCACTAPATLNDDMDEYFRPRSVFYVHPQGVHECADCIPGPGTAGTTGSGRSNIVNANNTTNITPIATLSSDKSNKSNRSIRSRSSGREQHTNEEDNMSSGGTGTGGSGRQTRQIYETAFDCKVPKSDDDLDEVVERLTSHNALLEIENGNNLKTKPPLELKSKSLKNNNKSNKLRYEGKRQKNTKNQQIQQDNGSNKNAIGSIQTLSNELENIHIENNSIDQLNNTTNETTATTSTSQLPTRGYTPSPPSTAPLPVKFPGKHDRFFMNSIKSAPSLPSSNPAHPRLRDLRLPIKSLRQQQLGLSASVEDSAATAQSDSVNNLLTGSNASSILDSGTGQMVVTESSTHSSMSRTRDRPRSIVVLESGRVLELRTGSAHKTMNSNGGHHHHNHHHGVAIHNTKTEVNIQKNITQHQQHINKTTTINYSSTESMATSSSGGSMESLRSSTSEGNRSTTSSESRHSTSLSSHSSESGTSVAFPLRAPILLHSKLHILSPISDKSSLEPASDASEFNKKQTPPGGLNSGDDCTKIGQLSNIQEQEQKTCDNTNTNDRNVGNNINNISSGGGGCPSIQKQVKKRIPQNKALLMLTDEILGSDSGISLHSREDNKIQSAFHRFGLPKLNFSTSEKLPDSGVNSVSIGLPQDLRDLPFDMPKLRRRKIILQQDVCTSGSATSVDLGDLPFDMPKLRRRLRMNSQQQQQINNLIVQSTESSGISQASSSHSVDQKPGLEGNLFRQNLTLNFNEIKSANNHKFGSLDLRGAPNLKGLNLNLSSSGIGYQSAVDLIDVTIPLERQGWYHGAITRLEAESTLRPLSEGSFLVRNCESTKQDYSLSLKGAKGFMHMRIQRNESNQYILGQFSRPFDSVPEMIRHFCINRLPVRGAEHMCLLDPVIVQLL